MQQASASSKELLFLGGTPRFERGNVAFVLLNDIAQLCIGGCLNFRTIGSFVVKQCIHWLNIISSFSCIKQRLVLGSVGGRWLACVNDIRPMPSQHGHNSPHSWVPDIPFPWMLCLCHSRSLLFLFDAHGWYRMPLSIAWTCLVHSSRSTRGSPRLSTARIVRMTRRGWGINVDLKSRSLDRLCGRKRSRVGVSFPAEDDRVSLRFLCASVCLLGWEGGVFRDGFAIPTTKFAFHVLDGKDRWMACGSFCTPIVPSIHPSIHPSSAFLWHGLCGHLNTTGSRIDPLSSPPSISSYPSDCPFLSLPHGVLPWHVSIRAATGVHVCVSRGVSFSSSSSSSSSSG